MQARAKLEAGASPILGPARLIRAAFEGLDLATCANEILSQSTDGVIEAGLALDLSTILLLMHRFDAALQLQSEVLQNDRHFALRSNAPNARTRVLVIVTAGDLMANTPIDFLLSDPSFCLEYLFILPGEEAPRHLPEHDVLVIGVAYSSVNEAILEALSRAAENWTRPIFNHPRRVINTSRHGLADALRDAEGILAPHTARIKRTDLVSKEFGLPAGFQFPVLIRPVDTHAGNDLQKADDTHGLIGYFDQASADDYYITQFIDYKSLDGSYRKFRVALIDGHPFVCHVALRDHWMIHYLNAGMIHDARKRDAEASAMAKFDTVFARRHHVAFSEIYRRTGLDYLVIDCAESPDGRLLVFEADTGMIVHDMDPADIFPYKQAHMQKVFSAFHKAIHARVD
ncbi:ATP-grasp domain-containing protein [Methylobacterium sp. P31]